MINFYRAWKDDKESDTKKSDTKKKKATPSARCKICDKAVNGLRDHVEGVHGAGMWKRYVAAEEAVKQQNLEQFRSLL